MPPVALPPLPRTPGGPAQASPLPAAPAEAPGATGQRRPACVVVIAIFFICMGAWSIWTIIASLACSRLYLNFGVLMLPVGIGLLNLKPWARCCAMVSVVITYVIAGIGAIIFLAAIASSGQAHVTWNGREAVGPERGWAAICCATMLFALTTWNIWMHRALTRPRVMTAFGLPPRQMPPPDEMPGHTE
jgi:hypothetical protein